MINEAYMEAIFKLLPPMMGCKRFERLGRESNGDFDLMVTRSDEALLLWALDCYWNVCAMDGLKVENDSRPMDQPYYIEESSRTKKNKGWKQEGKERYNELFEMVTENRKDAYWYGNLWRSRFQKRWECTVKVGRKGSDGSQPGVTGMAGLVSYDDL